MLFWSFEMVSIPRDLSLSAQPISTQKAQSRNKSPYTFAHLANFSDSRVRHV